LLRGSSSHIGSLIDIKKEISQIKVIGNAPSASKKSLRRRRGVGPDVDAQRGAGKATQGVKKKDFKKRGKGFSTSRPTPLGEKEKIDRRRKRQDSYTGKEGF